MGKPLLEIPDVTMLGSLIRFLVENDLETPQPMRANFGLMRKEYFELPKSVRKKTFIEDSKKTVEKLKEML